MTMTTEERLAALKARQAKRQPARAAAPAPPAPAVSTATTTGRLPQPPAVEVPSALSFPDPLPVPADPAMETIRMKATWVPVEPVTTGPILADTVSSTNYRPRPASGRAPTYKVPWERVSAGGAAVVSFFSMIVAMGPLFKGADAAVVTVAESGAPATGESAVAGTTAMTDPVAPVVDIQVAPVDPAAAAADPAAVAADTSASSVETVAATEAPAGQAPESQAPESQGPAAQAPATQAQAPATQPPATQAPATQAQAPATQPPATQAPATQAPTTQAPTTQPPTTAAPTTQPPATEPPTTATTAPPRSGGSGG